MNEIDRIKRNAGVSVRKVVKKPIKLAEGTIVRYKDKEYKVVLYDPNYQNIVGLLGENEQPDKLILAKVAEIEILGEQENKTETKVKDVLAKDEPLENQIDIDREQFVVKIPEDVEQDIKDALNFYKEKQEEYKTTNPALYRFYKELEHIVDLVYQTLKNTNSDEEIKQVLAKWLTFESPIRHRLPSLLDTWLMSIEFEKYLSDIPYNVFSRFEDNQEK